MFKQRKTRMYNLVICAALLISVMSGCVSSKKDEAANTAQPSSSAAQDITFPLKNRIKVSGFVLNMYGQDGKPNPVYQEMMNDTNIEITKEDMYTAGTDVNTKFAALIAAKNIPDISEVNGNAAQIKSWGDEGLFLNLKPYLDAGKMPNYKKFLDQYDGWKMVESPSGAIYQAEIFNETATLPSVGIMIRKDIFKKYGLKTEGYESWDDFLEAMKVIAEKTGNFVWDDWNSQILSLPPTLFNTSESVYFDGNKFVYGPYNDGFKQMTQFYNEMLKAKVIGQDWDSRDVTTMLADVGDGNRYVLTNNFAVADQLMPTMTKKTPDADFAAMAPPKIDGKYPMGGFKGSIPSLSAGYVISANTKYKDELVKFLDFWYSPEGIDLSLYGRKGIDYTIDSDGKYDRSKDLNTPVNPDGTRNMVDQGIMIRWMQDRTIESSETSVLGNRFIEGSNLYGSLGIVGPEQPYVELTADELNESTKLKSALNTYVGEKFAAYVNGQISFDKWDSDFIAGAKKLGADRLVEIYQTAYDRSKK